jgi:multicomponent Na+:H+ antiporter subunit C
MEILAAITVGILVAIGVWLLLDRNLVRVVLGVVVLGNAINLAVLTAGRFGAEAAAFVAPDHVPAQAANPLPQALVLTAIVIGFALFVFALAVLKRTWEEHGTTETDRVTAVAEGPAPDLPAELPHEADRAGGHSAPRTAPPSAAGDAGGQP